MANDALERGNCPDGRARKMQVRNITPFAVDDLPVGGDTALLRDDLRVDLVVCGVEPCLGVRRKTDMER